MATKKDKERRNNKQTGEGEKAFSKEEGEGMLLVIAFSVRVPTKHQLPFSHSSCLLTMYHMKAAFIAFSTPHAPHISVVTRFNPGGAICETKVRSSSQDKHAHRHRHRDTHTDIDTHTHTHSHTERRVFWRLSR